MKLATVVESLMRDSDFDPLPFLESVRADGLSVEEVAELTVALARSGEMLDWRSDPILGVRASVDLPSSGGLSNKTPLVAPILALAAASDRLFVPKLSSRGRVAGTIDTLEVLGFQPEPNLARYREILRKVGLVNAVQTSEFAPADGRLMRFRRELGFMKVKALVVSSILAKKVASGCRNVVVDLKCGPDSKFGDLEGDLDGARMFLDVGECLRDRGLLDSLWITVTNDSRCQGRAMGRTASLWEVARVLRGEESGFMTDLCVALAARILVCAEAASTLTEAARRCRATLGSNATETAGRWLGEQGARTEFLSRPESLLENLASTAILLGTQGRALDCHISSLGDWLLDASAEGQGDVAGLIFAQDPALGAALPFEVRVVRGSASRLSEPKREGVFAEYLGGAPIRDRPGVLFDAWIGPHGRGHAACWNREIVSLIALIRSAGHRLLMVWNSKWGMWNLLAGKGEASDETEAMGMRREVLEELGVEIGERPIPEAEIDCRLFKSGMEVWWSEREASWTLYRYRLFDVRLPNQEAHLEDLVQRHPEILCWASEEELRRGRLRSGATIAAFPAALFASRGLLDAASL